MRTLDGSQNLWLYLDSSSPGFDPHRLQACLQFGHIHFPIFVGVQFGEELLVHVRRIICAAAVREKQLPYDLIHG